MAPHFAGRDVDSPSHRQIPIRPRVDLSRSVIVEVRLTTGRTSRAEPITIGDPPPGDTPLVHLVIKMHKEAMTETGTLLFHNRHVEDGAVVPGRTRRYHRANVRSCSVPEVWLMRRQLLFVQGGGAGAHDDWDDKLVESLRRELGSNFEIRYPRMPNEGNPAYAAWKVTLEKEVATLDDDAILVGHSLGGTILINAIAKARSERQFGAIFLIAAPFVGDGGWPSEDMNPPPDLGARLPRDVPVFIYHGLDDETAPPSHAELYARAIPQARVRRLPHRDHQLNNDLSEIAATIESLEGGSQ